MFYEFAYVRERERERERYLQYCVEMSSQFSRYEHMTTVYESGVEIYNHTQKFCVRACVCVLVCVPVWCLGVVSVGAIAVVFSFFLLALLLLLVLLSPSAFHLHSRKKKTK